MTESQLCSGQSRGRTSVPPTEWSLILSAGGDGADARAALATFCRAYQPVAYDFFSRRRGAEYARDLTQAFFAKLIGRADLSAVRPGGRFRNWFYSALRSALCEDWRHQTCDKRDYRRASALDDAGDGDGVPASLLDCATPEWEFDRAWALALLDRVMETLEASEVAAGRGRDFLAAKPFLPHRNMSEPDYRPAEDAYGIRRGTLRFKVSKLSMRFSRALEDEIARTVGSPQEVSDELRHLYAALVRPRPKP